MNELVCETLEEGISATKSALHLVDAEVRKSGQQARAFDTMFTRKAIQECEAVACLLRADLRFPATAHLRTLTNVCATIRKLREGDPAANYMLFLESGTFEATRIFKTSEETGYRVTSIDTDEGWSALQHGIEGKYGHRFKGLDSWTDDPQWQKSVLLADDWLAFVHQLMQWYNKIQHASSLGLAMEGIAGLSLFIRSDDDRIDKDHALDRQIRLADWITHPTTIGMLAYGLLYDTVRTATNNPGGIVSERMETVESRLDKLWQQKEVRTIQDIVVIPKRY